MAYGHGISVSLMQLARAYTVFARDGELVPLSLVQTEAAPAATKTVFSRRTARAVRDMLELAVQPGGTAPRARIMGWRVAGKTGTAHKQENGGYAPDKYHLVVRRLRAGVAAAPGGRGDDRRAVRRPVLRRRRRGAGVRAGDAGRAAPARRAAGYADEAARAAGTDVRESDERRTRQGRRATREGFLATWTRKSTGFERIA